jgi:hypothetical protein
VKVDRCTRYMNVMPELLGLPADILLYLFAWCVKAGPLLRLTCQRLQNILDKDHQYKVCHLDYFVTRLPLMLLAPPHTHTRVRDLRRSDCRVICEAAGSGSLDVLQWAIGNGCKYMVEVSWKAAAGGHIHVLEWIRTLGGRVWDPHTTSHAAGRGHLTVLKWLSGEQCPMDHPTFEAAAYGGHLHVLKWANKQNCIWDTVTCTSAASGGHLNVLRWVMRRCKPGVSYLELYVEAISRGHTHILQWLFDTYKTHRYVDGDYIPTTGGETVSLSELLDNVGFTWDTTTSRNVALNQHWDMLRWAIEQGCACDWMVYHWAYVHKNEVMFKWMWDHGVPLPPPRDTNPRPGQTSLWSAPRFREWATKYSIPDPITTIREREVDEDEYVEDISDDIDAYDSEDETIAP